MKILRLLNKKNFLVIFIFFLSLFASAEDQPVDIWNIEKKETKEISQSEDSIIQSETDLNTNSDTDIFSMQSLKKTDTIKLDESLKTSEIKIYGLYDPEDYDLDINMWTNSNGDQLKNIFSRLNKIDLSQDASEIMKIALLTNSYSPKINLSEKNFLDLRSEWLIKNSDLLLIENYLIKNQIINLHPQLTKYLSK